MPPFVLDLTALRQGFSQMELEGGPGDLGLEGVEWFAPVRVQARLDRSGDQVSVRAALATEIRQECSRCLAVFDGPVSGEMAVYADRAGAGGQQVESELERGDYMRFHDGRQLDLREEIRESLLLELPMAPLCRADCRGLCLACGANLNEGPCGCARS
jgi:uncharacterized protein